MGAVRKLRGRRNRKTRYREKDLDQVQEEVRALASKPPRPLPIDLDKPGAGQFPCHLCNREFISAEVRSLHLKTKQHKKMVKLMKEVPYSQAEAEAAGK